MCIRDSPTPAISPGELATNTGEAKIWLRGADPAPGLIFGPGFIAPHAQGKRTRRRRHALPQGRLLQPSSAVHPTQFFSSHIPHARVRTGIFINHPGVPNGPVFLPSDKMDHFELQSTHHNPARSIPKEHVTVTVDFRERRLASQRRKWSVEELR